VGSRRLVRGFGAVLALATAVGLAGCSGGKDDDKKAEVAAGCAPAKSTGLVALNDPKGLVATDAAIAAVSAKAKYRDLITPLTRVSISLDQASLNAAADKLAGKKASGVQVAAAFFKAKRITIAKQGSGRVTLATTDEPTRSAAAAFYAEGLRRAGYSVSTVALADDKAIVAALKANTVQVAPQFTESALASLQPKATKDRSLQQTMLALGTAGLKSGVVYAAPAKAGLQPVYAVSAEVARKNNLASLDDFAKRCSGTGTVLVSEATCVAAGGCADGLSAKYGIKVGSVTEAKDVASARAAVRDGKATIVAVAATDPALVR
jgi:osmoprotectant transport system substrate-binding protein